MIKKLKRNFIIINMSIVGSVLFLIFLTICILTYNIELKNTQKSLENSVRFFNGERFPEMSTDAPPIRDDSALPPRDELGSLPDIYAFSVIVKADGTIEKLNSSRFEDVELEKLVKEALSSSKETGQMRNNTLMFLKKVVSEGTLLAFTTCEPFNASVRNTILISISLFIFSMLLMFFISERLASYSIKPVDTAWKKQKQFVLDASHDLKTPLTVILANTDILNSHTESTILEQKKWIDSTNEQALLMKSLVEEMLALAKSEQEGMEVVFTCEDVSEIVSRVALQLEGVAFEKQITLASCVESDIRCYINTEYFIRLIQILIDNAIKYSPQKSTINIVLKRENKGIAFSVNNQGKTIPRKELDLLFERFYRGDSSRSTSGHGLGLPIAKNLAEILNGEISVSSNEESGTTFTVTFSQPYKKHL